MKYEIKPCVEEDEDFIEEKLDAFCYSIVPPEEGAKDEDIVFKITIHRRQAAVTSTYRSTKKRWMKTAT